MCLWTLALNTHDRHTATAVALGVCCEVNDGCEGLHEVQPRYELPREVDETPLSLRPRRLRRLLPIRRWSVGRRRSPRSMSRSRAIKFIEFVELSDGSRLILRSDRGLSWSASHARSPWYGITREGISDEVREHFLQLERDRPLTPAEVVGQIRDLHGIEADAGSVREAVARERVIELGSTIEEALVRQ